MKTSLIGFVLLFLVSFYACSSKKYSQKDCASYQIISTSESTDEVVRNLQDEFNGMIELVSDSDLKESCNRIELAINPSLQSDCEFSLDQSSVVVLKAKDEEKLHWISSQYLVSLNELNSDFPPAILSFDSSFTHSFSFEYREPHYPSNLIQRNNQFLATNNLELDWGVWGHNLGKLLNKEGNEDCYSQINGVVNRNQICFSSESTFDFIRNFILHNFGDGKENEKNFLIAPNDNALVCSCSKCVSVNNSKKDASQSVLNLIERLATLYPKHTFFTMDYLSVQRAAEKKLPSNVGVFVSALYFPQRHDLKKAEKFTEKVNNWIQKSEKVYVWDYCSNFDDYLTPYPNLQILQNRLKYFQKLGVKGVFANGSGYDYSCFEEMKTFVSAALMNNPNENVASLVKTYFQKSYPETGAILTSIYWSMEESLLKSHSALQMYGGTKSILDCAIDEKSFRDNYQLLLEKVKTVKKPEREKLMKILTSLTFTRLQIMLKNGFQSNGVGIWTEKQQFLVSSDFKQVFEFFKTNYKKFGIENFKESGGLLKDYLEEIELNFFNEEMEMGKLFQSKLTAQSKLDEGFQDVSILTDGIHGITNDYHQGWFFVSQEDLVLKLPVKLEGKNKLSISFLENEKLKLLPPKAIKLYSNGNFIGEAWRVESVLPKRAVYSIDLPENASQLEIKISRNEKFGKFACDEIDIR